jgi:hypothetical protein
LPEPKNPGSGLTIVNEKADELGLNHEVTPLLSRDEAEKHVPIAGAHVGVARLGGGAKFVDHFFDKQGTVYEHIELADIGGLRYLAWKLADQPEELPTLDRARPRVVEAWKLEKARALAEADAQQLAEAARKSGDLKAAAGSRLVLTTSEVSKVAVALDRSTRQSDIPEIPQAGKALRDALFALKPREIIVEPNSPVTTYYVLALDKRTPADLKNLFGPLGMRDYVEQGVALEATIERLRGWIDYLREQTGAVIVHEAPAGDPAEHPLDPTGE